MNYFFGIAFMIVGIMHSIQGNLEVWAILSVGGFIICQLEERK